MIWVADRGTVCGGVLAATFCTLREIYWTNGNGKILTPTGMCMYVYVRILCVRMYVYVHLCITYVYLCVSICFSLSFGALE